VQRALGSQPFSLMLHRCGFDTRRFRRILPSPVKRQSGQRPKPPFRSGSLGSVAPGAWQGVCLRCRSAESSSHRATLGDGIFGGGQHSRLERFSVARAHGCSQAVFGIPVNRPPVRRALALRPVSGATTACESAAIRRRGRTPACRSGSTRCRANSSAGRPPISRGR